MITRPKSYMDQHQSGETRHWEYTRENLEVNRDCFFLLSIKTYCETAHSNGKQKIQRVDSFSVSYIQSRFKLQVKPALRISNITVTLWARTAVKTREYFPNRFADDFSISH
jgi:hypothetical protein